MYKNIGADMSLNIFSVATNYLPNILSDFSQPGHYQEDKKEDEKGEFEPLTRN